MHERNSTRKPKGKSRSGDMFGWEGVKKRVWVRGLGSFCPDYGQVLEPVERGNEPLSYVKYGTFND